VIVYWLLTCAFCYEDYAILTDRGLSEVPKDLQQNVTILDLSNNSITTIERNDFSKVRQVKNINLSYNKIHIIYEGSFQYVGDLEELNLSYNNIINLPPNIFSGNNNLTKVYLQKNWLKVTGYESKTWHILESTSLTYLDISFCNITSISQESFSGLPNLETLKLSGNSLKHLDVEIIKTLKNLKEMHIEFCNPSTFEKFCFHLREQIMKFTLFPPCSSSNKTRELDGMDLNILTTGIIMCACVFLITLTAYITIIRCKTRETVASEKHDSENIIQQRPLPQPPDPTDGYEVPVTERFSSTCSRNRQVRRERGYNSLPLENNLNASNRNVSGKDHVLTGRISGSIQSSQYTTDYQDSTPYPSPSQINSRSDRNKEEKSNLSVPCIRGTCSIPKKLKFPTEYRASCTYRTSTVGGLRTGPLRPLQMTKPLSRDRYSEDRKKSLPPAPPRPVSTLQSPVTHDAATVYVKSSESETMFVSSVFIELGQNSRSAYQEYITMGDIKQTVTQQKSLPIPPRSFERNKPNIPNGD
jgi:hypothetical protein